MIQPPPRHITPHGKTILEVIRHENRVFKDYNNAVGAKPKELTAHAEGWMGRSLIAWALDKKRLTVYDIALLDLLTEQGLIEARERPGGSFFGYTWEYRAKREG